MNAPKTVVPARELDRLTIDTFEDYRACPFRCYLRHVVRREHRTRIPEERRLAFYARAALVSSWRSFARTKLEPTAEDLEDAALEQVDRVETEPIARRAAKLAASWWTQAPPGFTPAAIDRTYTAWMGEEPREWGLSGRADLVYREARSPSTARIAHVVVRREPMSDREARDSLSLPWHWFALRALGVEEPRPELVVLLEDREPQRFAPVVDEAWRRNFLRLVASIREAMRVGFHVYTWFPNRTARTCSREDCSVAQSCEREFGPLD